MIKKYACLDEQNVVIAVEELDMLKFDSYPGALTYIEVDNGIRPIPQIGQIWDGINNFQ